MGTIGQDVRYACRRLTRSKNFACAVAFVLALGIGPNVLVYSILRATLLRPIPYKESRDLVIIQNLFSTSTQSVSNVSPVQFEQWREQHRLFVDVGALEFWVPQVLTGTREPQRLQVVRISPTLFAVLGTHPILGRGFIRSEPSNDEVLLSYGLWRRQFNADPSIVGRRVSLSGHGYTIIGVMPEGFDVVHLLFPLRPNVDAWVPLQFSPSELSQNSMTLTTVARLRPGISPIIVSRRLSSILPPQLQKDGVRGVNVVGLRDAIIGKARSGLLLLAATVGFVLLLACANVANLLLVRSDADRRDTAIRLALGATRWRIARQLLTELILLALGGAALGILLAYWGVRLVPSVLPADLPRLAQPRIDSIVIAMTVLSTLFAVILSGLVPSLASTSEPLNALASTTALSSSSPRRRGFRNALVVTEIALAVILTSAAALTLRGFWRLVSVPAGFDPTRVFTVGISLPQSRYAKDRQVAQFIDSLMVHLRSLGNVRVAAAATGLPGIFTGAGTTFSPWLESSQPQVFHMSADLDSVTGTYFQALGIPLIIGRTFGPQDGTGTERVTIVDTAVAELLGPGPAVGKEVILDDPKVEYEVVGVVGRVHLFGDPRDVAPHIYIPMSQSPLPVFTLLLKTNQATGGLASTVRNAINGIDPELPTGEVVPLSERISAQNAGPRFHLTMLGVFGLLALMLAGFGVFSVTAYAVSLRRHELAIRSCLGASRDSLIFLVLGDGIRLVISGVALGLFGGAIVAKFLSAAFLEIKLDDPITIGGAVMLVILATLSATLMPARRANQIDPATELRAE